MATMMNRVKTTTDLELKDRLVAVNRVTKVTKGGRTFSFSAIVVVGNEDGIVGWGLGKASEVTAAIAKGTEAAKKNLIKYRYSMVLFPTSRKQNLEAHASLFAIFRYRSNCRRCYARSTRKCRYTDVLAKSRGSSNPHNLVKATVRLYPNSAHAHTVAQNRRFLWIRFLI